MPAVELTEPQFRRPFSAPGVFSQRLANQLRLRAPFASGKLTNGYGEIGIERDSRLHHLSGMVSYGTIDREIFRRQPALIPRC